MMKQILLVDDDLDDTDLFKEALNEVDKALIIHILHSAPEALLFLNNKDQHKPDIIFMDVNMPLMNGWECLEQIKHSDLLATIPVVMYSTSSYRGDSDKAHEMGALCFFTKPSSYADLKKIIRIIISHHSGNLQEAISMI